MTDLSVDRPKDAEVLLDWPASVAAEPDYPVLAPAKVDLACDAMVFKPPYDPDEDY